MDVMIQGCHLLGVSAAVPDQKISITDYYPIYGELEVKRIALGTGIESMRVARKETRASDLCETAALQLFHELAIDRDSIDGIVFVSQTPDYCMPATSALLQYRLGLNKSVVAFDINYGCSGYIYGLYQAAMLVQSGGCGRVLLCAGDTITRHLDPADHKVMLVFGDAGSASLIEKGDDVWVFDIHTDGSGADALKIGKNHLGQNQPLFMNGGAVMEFALKEVRPVIERVLTMRAWEKSVLSQVVFHQANLFMLNYLRKQLAVDKSIVPIAVKHYGNTGPASIPLTLCDQYAEKKNLLGNAVLCGFGVGLSWGACALDLSASYMTHVVTHENDTHLIGREECLLQH